MTTSNRRVLSPQVSLSANLISERARQRLSQAELAKRAAVSRHTIVRLESADYTNPGLELLDKIARTLGVSVHELLRPAAYEDAVADDEELLRRIETSTDADFVDASDYLAAHDEASRSAAGLVARRRYSNRGRRRVVRGVAPRRS
jgi:transcriptional regulator with XRE-family HTH domain